MDGLDWTELFLTLQFLFPLKIRQRLANSVQFLLWKHEHDGQRQTHRSHKYRPIRQMLSQALDRFSLHLDKNERFLEAIHRLHSFSKWLLLLHRRMLHLFLSHVFQADRSNAEQPHLSVTLRRLFLLGGQDGSLRSLLHLVRLNSELLEVLREYVCRL